MSYALVTYRVSGPAVLGPLAGALSVRVIVSIDWTIDRIPSEDGQGEYDIAAEEARAIADAYESTEPMHIAAAEPASAAEVAEFVTSGNAAEQLALQPYDIVCDRDSLTAEFIGVT